MIPGMSELTPANDCVRYACWAVFRRSEQPAASGALGTSPARWEQCQAELAADGVAVRGWYDLSAMRGDADLMVWMHAAEPTSLQQGVRRIRRELRGAATQTWAGTGVHRPAEFNRGHIPAFLSGEPPRTWLALYPFVRSYEWYLLPAEERAALLAEHGRMGREYPGVLGNTVASFGLGDWEWLLGLEAANLLDIVDLLRHLRASAARRHVRVEVPFFTGRLLESAAEISEVLA